MNQCFICSLYPVEKIKKKWQKKKRKKFYLPIYPIFWSMQPPVSYPDIFSYCWISISKSMWEKYFWLIIAGFPPLPPLYKRDENESSVYSYENGEEYIFLKNKREFGKMVEEWRLLRENNLWLLANLCIYKPKKHYNSRCKYIYMYIYIYIYTYIYIFLFKYCSSISGTNISTKMLPAVDTFSLTILTCLKMLTRIKSLNTKQSLASQLDYFFSLSN